MVGRGEGGRGWLGQWGGWEGGGRGYKTGGEGRENEKKVTSAFLRMRLGFIVTGVYTCVCACVCEYVQVAKDHYSFNYERLYSE